MRISFHGAAGDVTGSCHLVEAAGKRILIDCGMFQGSRRLSEENSDPFGFELATVDLLLLTHAHLDHCGRIPLLAKRGYRAPVITTAATQDLAKLVLLDAAGLQQEEARRHDSAPGPHGHGHSDAHGNGHNDVHGNGRGSSNDAAAAPLYDTTDVNQALALFQAKASYGTRIELAPGIHATFNDAGHILGSAWILLEVNEGTARHRVVFSGDLGNRDKPILHPLMPAPAPAADAIVMESTYGDRNHRSQANSIQEFRQAVATTLARGGNVVIPTFALERAQDLLYYLREMVEQKVIGAATPVYLDSPMAISATEIFGRHPECYNAATAALLAAGKDPFGLPGLHFTRDREASMAINAVRGAIIMAGSGMASGGRIVHHLSHQLGREANSVIFVGYAAQGTLARLIIDGAEQVRILGDVVPVRAQVHTIGGFSAHADHDELMRWAQSGGRPGRVFLVHGEATAAQVLARDLGAQGIAVTVPKMGDSVELAAAQGTASAS